jgi:hypothetical protein
MRSSTRAPRQRENPSEGSSSRFASLCGAAESSRHARRSRSCDEPMVIEPGAVRPDLRAPPRPCFPPELPFAKPDARKHPSLDTHRARNRIGLEGKPSGPGRDGLRGIEHPLVRRGRTGQGEHGVGGYDHPREQQASRESPFTDLLHGIASLPGRSATQPACPAGLRLDPRSSSSSTFGWFRRWQLSITSPGLVQYSCPAIGRRARGGCPIQWTSGRSPSTRLDSSPIRHRVRGRLRVRAGTGGSGCKRAIA